MKLKSVIGTKALGVASAAFLCLVALATPVGASMLRRGGLEGFGVTDPGSLTLLGAALIGMGVWARRLLSPRRVRA